MDYIKLIGSECSDGMIIIDPTQTILWANAAALALHQVADVKDLGETIDDYHAQFHVKYVAVKPEASRDASRAAGSEHGRLQPEVMMEMRPNAEQKFVLRTRKMVLFDEKKRPECIVFYIHRMLAPEGNADRFSELLRMFPYPAALLRPEGRDIVAANGLYEKLTEGDGSAAEARRGSWETTVELDGQPFTLLHCGAAGADTAQGQCAGPMPGPLAALTSMDGVAMHALDSDMRIVNVSQTWLEWLGYTRDAVIGHTVFEFMTAASAQCLERNDATPPVNAGNPSGVPADFTNVKGEVVNALMYPAMTPARGDGQSPTIFICVDVTGQKDLEDNWTSTFALVPVPMLVRNGDDGRIIDANQAYLKATGYGLPEIIGRGFDELGSFESKKHKEEFESAIRAAGRSGAASVTLKTVHGDTLDCQLTATNIWRAGKPCMLFALQDVSERRRTELELMSALEAVMKDGSWFSQSVVERLAALRTPPKSGRRTAALGDLTPRERDVLSLISLGLPDSEIAARLGLTKSTIRNHLSTLYSKINVKNRGSAIIWARERCMNVTQLPLRPKTTQPKFGAVGL